MTERHQCGDSGQNGTEVWGQRPTLTVCSWASPSGLELARVGEGTAVCAPYSWLLALFGAVSKGSCSSQIRE